MFPPCTGASSILQLQTLSYTNSKKGAPKNVGAFLNRLKGLHGKITFEGKSCHVLGWGRTKGVECYRYASGKEAGRTEIEP